MKIDDVRWVNLFDLTKVDDRAAFLAEDSINFKLFKGTANGMGLRCLPRCVVELVHARKEVRRFPAIEAEIFFPVSLDCGGHSRNAPFPFDTVAGSARRWYAQPSACFSDRME